MFSLKALFKRTKLFNKFEYYLESKINHLIDIRLEQNFAYYEWVYEKRIQEHDFLIKKLSNNYVLKCYFDSKIAELIYTGPFEREEILFMNTILKKGHIFIDIGANIGLFSIHASSRVGETGAIYSFEPTNITFNRLLENIEINNIKNITPINIAISNSTGTTILNVSEDGFDAWNSIAEPTSGSIFTKQVVNTTTLDDYLSEMQIEIDKIGLIKIDVEGWEIPVIQGAKELLSQPNSPNLMIEFTEENARSAGYNCQDLYRLIESFGYSWFKYNSKKNILEHCEIKPYFNYQNLIASKKIDALVKRLNR